MFFCFHLILDSFYIQQDAETSPFVSKLTKPHSSWHQPTRQGVNLLNTYFSIYYPPELSGMKYCCLGVLKGTNRQHSGQMDQNIQI